MSTVAMPPGHISTPVQLPELLTKIFEHILPQSSLFSCMQVCKGWKVLAEPLQYADVVLNTSNLAVYLSQTSSNTNTYTRTLTLHLDPVRAEPTEDEVALRREGSRAAQDLWGNIEALGNKVHEMVLLYSLSVFRSSVSPFPGFWISRHSVAKLVDDLLPTCVSLEIDIRDNDYCSQPSPRHLCTSIRRLLPYLNYLRLRLPALCPEICGTGLDANHPDTIPTDYRPTKAPHLKQCIINTARTAGFAASAPSLVCSTFEESEWHNSGGNIPDARKIMAHYLRQVFKSLCLPEIEKLLIIDYQRQDQADFASYGAHIRRDVIKNSTEALPGRDIGGLFKKDGWLVRTPEGNDYISFLWVHEVLTEGDAWQEALNGLRLPSHMMASSIYVPKALPLRNREEFCKETNMTCTLWCNEEKLGVRLLDSNQREGLEDDLLVREDTPDGWTRLSGGDLFRDEEVVLVDGEWYSA